ncbi:MAG: hypothetical protein CME06_06085 [Gemmatimonadetes bacterium]|nr:hypothetical protein [Gemmatimonadota bacterium]
MKKLLLATAVAFVATPSIALADDYSASSLLFEEEWHPARVHVHSVPSRHAAGSTYLRLGSFKPTSDDLNTGVALGLEFAGGSTGRLEFGFSIDYYRNAIHDPNSVFQGEDLLGNPIEIIEQGDSYVSNHVPMLFTGRYFLPVLSETGFNPYFSGGLGYGVVWTVQNREGKISRDVYGGIAWQVGGGAGFHLSNMVSLIGELRYTHNVVRSREEIGDKIYITRLDASGPSAWVGLRFGI